MIRLPHIRSRLLRHPLGEQILVYDTDRDRIHLLDPTTASVLDSLDRGDSAQVIARDLERLSGTTRGEELLTAAIDQLANAELTEQVTEAASGGEVTRRELLSAFAGTAAAVLVPTILTLTPNSALGQASLSCGSPCTTTVSCPGTTRATCHCCKIGGNTAGTCSTELSGNCQNP